MQYVKAKSKLLLRN